MTHRDAFSLFLLTRAHVWHQWDFRRHDPTCDMAAPNPDDDLDWSDGEAPDG